MHAPWYQENFASLSVDAAPRSHATVLRRLPGDRPPAAPATHLAMHSRHVPVRADPGFPFPAATEAAYFAAGSGGSGAQDFSYEPTRSQSLGANVGCGSRRGDWPPPRPATLRISSWSRFAEDRERPPQPSHDHSRDHSYNPRRPNRSAGDDLGHFTRSVSLGTGRGRTAFQEAHPPLQTLRAPSAEYDRRRSHDGCCPAPLHRTSAGRCGSGAVYIRRISGSSRQPGEDLVRTSGSLPQPREDLVCANGSWRQPYDDFVRTSGDVEVRCSSASSRQPRDGLMRTSVGADVRRSSSSSRQLQGDAAHGGGDAGARRRSAELRSVSSGADRRRRRQRRVEHGAVDVNEAFILQRRSQVGALHSLTLLSQILLGCGFSLWRCMHCEI